MYRLFHLNERKAIWHSIKQECSWSMGNLGFMKSKPLVCRAFAENRRKSRYPSPLFYGFPRPQLYPHGKRRCSAPGAPAQQAEADLARIKEVRSCRKSNGISKRSNESGWLFSGRCVSDTPFLPWGKSRSSHLMPDWIKIAILIGQNIGFVRLRFYYTHFKLCCWQSFFASIIGGTCNFEKHCLFFAYLTTKFI